MIHRQYSCVFAKASQTEAGVTLKTREGKIVNISTLFYYLNPQAERLRYRPSIICGCTLYIETLWGKYNSSIFVSPNHYMPF